METRMRPGRHLFECGALQPDDGTSGHGALHDPVLYPRTRLDGLCHYPAQREWLMHSLCMAQRSTDARCSSKLQGIQRCQSCGRRCEWLICGDTKQQVYMVVRCP